MAEHGTREHLEHAEHAEHAAHAGDPFITKVSVTIAFLAVIAATIGSLETIETAGVTVAKSEAVLAQNKRRTREFLPGAQHQGEHVRDRLDRQSGQGGDVRCAGEEEPRRAGRHQATRGRIREEVGSRAPPQAKATNIAITY